METGWVDFLRTYHHNEPELVQIRCITYEDMYRIPWATSRDIEIQHKSLMESIGKSLKSTF